MLWLSLKSLISFVPESQKRAPNWISVILVLEMLNVNVLLNVKS